MSLPSTSLSVSRTRDHSFIRFYSSISSLVLYICCLRLHFDYHCPLYFFSFEAFTLSYAGTSSYMPCSSGCSYRHLTRPSMLTHYEASCASCLLIAPAHYTCFSCLLTKPTIYCCRSPVVLSHHPLFHDKAINKCFCPFSSSSLFFSLPSSCFRAILLSYWTIMSVAVSKGTDEASYIHFSKILHLRINCSDNSHHHTACACNWMSSMCIYPSQCESIAPPPHHTALHVMHHWGIAM